MQTISDCIFMTHFIYAIGCFDGDFCFAIEHACQKTNQILFNQKINNFMFKFAILL